MNRKPQGGVFATLASYPYPLRVWVESINSLQSTALVREIPAKGRPYAPRRVKIAELDFGKVSQ